MEKSIKGIVLSSGGVDSTTALGLAIKSLGQENIISVSVSYGQRHSRELDAAEKIAQYYGIRHEVIDLSAIYQYSNCALLEHSDKEVPEGSYAEQLEGKEAGVDTAVPFRNGLMLSAVAALAQSIFPDDDINIYLGNHADDAAGNAYADCSPEFSKAIGRAIWLGTYKKVAVLTPFVHMNKSQVVRQGLALGVPYELTTSCYKGGKKACGKCGTCLDRIAAFEANGVKDPIEYETYEEDNDGDMENK